MFERACRLGLLLLALVSSLSRVTACDIPVCQYALTLWPADAYEAIVVHQGEPLAVQTLKDLRALPAQRANLVVRETSLEDTTERFADILATPPVESAPWLAIRYPVRNDGREVVWTGPLASTTAADWLDSPFRKTLVRHLQQGYSTVWILLESGQRSRDEAAFRVLSDELDRLERVLRLSGSGQGEDARAPNFARLRLSREDPREAALITMLMGSEPDLTERRDKPIVFPIYGRGLILYALVGNGIHAGTITSAAEFMTGACSCEVKSQNPGLELLLSADWDEVQVGGLADYQKRADQAETLLADVRGIASSNVFANKTWLLADVPDSPSANTLTDEHVAEKNGAPAAESKHGSSKKIGLIAVSSLLAVAVALRISGWRRKRNNR